MKVRVVRYDPSWPAAFVSEAERINAIMRDVVVHLHHIGSTSIPGIMAKPIVDMLMEVTDLDALDQRTSDLLSLGYEAKGEFGIPGRRYFRRDDRHGARAHQIHAFRVGSPDVLRHLAFRDYMIAHAEIALQYGELKKDLAARFPDDIHGYMDGKDAFIKEHQARAIQWCEVRKSQQVISTPYDNIVSEFGAARSGFRPNEMNYLGLALDGLPPGGLVLDLGCGNGHPIATFIDLLGHRVVGVDGSGLMLDEARRRLPHHRWVHSLIQEVDFDEEFDAVICWDSLFHVGREEWRRVLDRVARWLKPEGRLMMSSGGIVPDDGGFTDTMLGHEFYFDSLPPDRLLELLQETGFRIVLAEMCDRPDGGRNRGKWATVAARTG